MRNNTPTKNLLLLTASIVAINAAVPHLARISLHSLSNALQLSVAPATCDLIRYYIGINGGWDSSHNCWDFAGVTPKGFYGKIAGTIAGQIGYRWQMFNVV